ncbi:hypothetical protein [Natroniella sp. ANB-PHB2]|uniref:hypothetical protein n=1 Tax=Natroniella sp. ANB-PHB2 TaxID=3384444 RepID=UPI0038D42465
MGKWFCTKCGWIGNELALLKIKRVGYFRLYKGCLECGVDIDQVEVLINYNRK